MAQTAQQGPLPLIDDITVKDTLADTCVGVSAFAGNVHMTFASVTADYSSDPAPLRRIISSRLVMPLQGMMELRDMLNQIIAGLTAQGVIAPAATPVITAPSDQPN
jgi:hypothetical protein